MLCSVCEVDKPDGDFPYEGAGVCTECISAIGKLNRVDFEPQCKRTVVSAYLSLILAIRDQAESDGDIATFERYWFHTTPWNQIFALVAESVRASNSKDIEEVF